MSLFLRGTMLVCASGLSRSEAVLKILTATVPCAAKVSAPSFGARTADGLSAQGVTERSRSSQDERSNVESVFLRIAGYGCRMGILWMHQWAHQIGPGFVSKFDMVRCMASGLSPVSWVAGSLGDS